MTSISNWKTTKDGGCDGDSLSRAGATAELALLAAFSVQLDMWSREPITTPAGKRMPVRDWVRQFGVNYAPGIVLFDRSGKEAISWESSFRVFHTMDTFDYVASGQYLALTCLSNARSTNMAASSGADARRDVLDSNLL